LDAYALAYGHGYTHALAYGHGHAHALAHGHGYTGYTVVYPSGRHSTPAPGDTFAYTRLS
jgi:hypothetical protein